MAHLRLQPPEQFNFKNPDDWPRWKRRFQQFRVASGLASDDEAKQISTLLYCLGEQAEAVLGSTDITEEERKVYDTIVVAKLDGFFQVRSIRTCPVQPAEPTRGRRRRALHNGAV